MTKKRQTDTNSSKFKTKNLIKISGGLVLVLVTSLVLVSYTGLRPAFLSANFVDKVDVALGSLPFIPKTNGQVLKTAFYKNSQISSASEVASLVLSEAGQKALQLNFEGSFSTRQEKTYQAKVVGSLGTRGEVKLIDLETFQKESEMAFKVDSFHQSLGMNLTSVYGKWYQLNIDDLVTSFRAEAKSDESIKKEIRTFLRKGLESSELNFKELKRETVKEKGKNFLKFSTDLGSDEVDKFFSANLKTKNSRLVLVVDEKSGFLVSLSFSAEVAVSTLNEFGVNPFFKNPAQMVQINFQVDLDKINQKISFSEPENVTTMSSSLEILQEILGKKAGSDPNSFYNLVNQNVEFGSNLIALERLGHVLFLAPVSF